MSEQPELISRKTLFDNPDCTGVQLSHDGEHVSYLAPVDGVMNVWVAPVDSVEEARPVTRDTGRGIRAYFWSYNPAHVLYVQDRAGDEDWHVFTVNIENGETRDLTPYEGVSALPGRDFRSRYPDEVLVGVNRRDPQYHDLFRSQRTDGRFTPRRMENNIGAAQILADNDLEPRLARVSTPDGGSELPRAERIRSVGVRNGHRAGGRYDHLRALYFEPEGRTLYMLDSRGRDTSALMALHTETGDATELAGDPRADVSGIIPHPVTRRPQAVSFEYDRVSWIVTDDSIAGDLNRIAAQENGDFDVASRSVDDSRWIVQFAKDDGPVTYYLYDRDSGDMHYLFSKSTGPRIGAPGSDAHGGRRARGTVWT